MGDKSPADVMYPAASGQSWNAEGTAAQPDVTQAALNHLSARLAAVKEGKGPRPSKQEIDAWDSLGEHVDNLKKAYADSAKRGLEPASDN